jgi:phage terminase small subunit
MTDHLRLVGAQPAPEYLLPGSVKLWNSTLETWAFHPAEAELLAAGLRQLDTHRRAMETVEAEGVTVESPSGLQKPHPCLAVAHAALRAYRQVLAHLDLELPVDAPPRARGSGSQRRQRRG